MYNHGYMPESTKATTRTTDYLQGATKANVAYSQFVVADLQELVHKWRFTAQPAATPTIAPEMDVTTAQPTKRQHT